MAQNNPYGSSQELATEPAAVFGYRTYQLKRIDIVSASLMLGALYTMIGLILGAIVSVMAVLGIAIGGGQNAIAGVIGGIGALLFFPILYGILGLLGGAIVAAMYNVVAGVVGGIRIDLEG